MGTDARWGRGLVRSWAGALSLLVCASILATAIPAAAIEPPPQAPQRPTAEELPEAAGTTVIDTPTPADFPDVTQVTDAIWEYAISLPVEQWDIEALAGELAFDPMAAFEFVRDHIRYEPYRGVLRGAEGTLAARAGNSVDRSLLLAALLDEMLVDYEFVLADLDDLAAAEALSAARHGAPQQLDAELPGSRVDTGSIERRARRDFALLREALSAHLDFDAGNDEAAANADARTHAWLRMARGADSLDLDTTMPAALPGDVLAEASHLARDLPDDLHQRVRIRVVIEELGEGLTERILLDQRLDADEAAARDMFLFFEPDLSGFAGAIEAVMSGDERWSPHLMIDGEVVAGDSFSAGGSGVDLFGDPTELPELASLRLMVAVEGPGLDPIEATHVLFDRTGDARDPLDGLAPLEIEDGVPQALRGLSHIMVSTGGADPRAYAFEQVQVLDFIDGALIDPNAATQYGLADRLWPLAMAGEGLVLTSEQVVVPAAGDGVGHGYVARPRVYVTSMTPEPGQLDSLVEVTDLLIDSVRILPSEPGTATAAAQLWYGALQSALETETALTRLSAFETDGLTVEGASLSMTEPLRVLLPGSDAPLTEAQPALRADAERGAIIVSATEPVAAQAWWAIEPDTGVTRAMLAPGLGGLRDVLDGEDGESVFSTSKAKHLFGGTKSGYRKYHPPGGSHRALGYDNRPYKPPKKPGLPRGTKFKPPRTSIPSRPNPVPRCTGGQEYATVVGCVSLPTAIVFYTLGAVYSTSITGIAYGLMKRYWG